MNAAGRLSAYDRDTNTPFPNELYKYTISDTYFPRIQGGDVNKTVCEDVTQIFAVSVLQVRNIVNLSSADHVFSISL